MERAQGFATQGGRVVWTLGYSSTTLVQDSVPYATITVYITGTTILATIYSDNQLPPTPMANPFTANADGYWFFYATDGRYDVRMTAPQWDWTIGDLILQDPFRWSADQNANGHWLNNLGGISFINGACHESITLDASCNMLWLGPSNNTLMSLSPQGDLAIPGCLTTACIHLNNTICATTISFDTNCDVIFTGGSGNRLATLDQQGGLTLAGWLNTPGIYLNNGTCSTTIQFDANCYVVVYGSLGVTGNLDVNGSTNLAGDLKVDGGFILNGPWLTDQHANGHSLYGLQKLEVSQIEFNNGTCQAELQFDANCYLVLYGSLGVNSNLDVNGLTNLAGDLKVDGSFTLNGPWLEDQNANGKSLYGLQKLEVAQIEFHDGACTAELQFDAACNLVVYGNLKIAGNLDVSGTGGGGTFTAGGPVTPRSLNQEIQNTTGKAVLVTIGLHFNAALNSTAYVGAVTPSSTPVARISTSDAGQYLMTFVVLPGQWYRIYADGGITYQEWSEWW